MCCSELIKTFDFFPERARLGVCVHACTRVCESKRVRPVQKQSYMCICTRRREKALGLLWCYLFFQPCHTNYSPYLLTLSFCLCPR